MVHRVLVSSILARLGRMKGVTDKAKFDVFAPLKVLGFGRCHYFQSSFPQGEVVITKIEKDFLTVVFSLPNGKRSHWYVLLVRRANTRALLHYERSFQHKERYKTVYPLIRNIISQAVWEPKS